MVSRKGSRIFILGAILLIAVFGLSFCSLDERNCFQTEEDGSMSFGDASIVDIDALQAKSLIDVNQGNDNFVILDIRTKKEFDQGHIEGSLLIDYYKSDFETNLDMLDKNKTYFIYCRSGNRSGKAKGIMAKLGFLKVYSLANGFNEWSRKGLPTVG